MDFGPILEAIPNVSCSGGHMVERLTKELGSSGATIADVHIDHDHGRTVFTTFGNPAQLVAGLGALARLAASELDLRDSGGIHPRTGVVDVIPIVALDPADEAAAHTTVVEVAQAVARAGIPVVGYGEGQPLGRTGAARQLGPQLFSAAQKGQGAELLAMPEEGWGPLERTGVALVGVRPILVACNLWFGPFADIAITARARQTMAKVARLVRESGSGLAGVRTLALELPSSGVVQLSMNIEQPMQTTPSDLFDCVADALLDESLFGSTHPEDPVAFELVGLAPAAWLDELRAECSLRNLRLYAAEDSVESWLARVRPPDV